MAWLNPEISLVIPVYDEAENSTILYEQIRSSLDPLKKPCEIIIIDDGSTDGTLEVLRRIKERENCDESRLIQTRIIHFPRNFGQTAAMQAGFDHARANIIVSMDGDLQNDPRDIPRLLDKLTEGYDVVCGWRKNRKDKRLTRILPSKVANWLIAKLTGVPIHDNGCSLKAYRSSVIKSLKLYSDMHRFIPAASTLTGANIAEIVVNHRPRIHGKTKYGLSRIWKVVFDIITLKMLIHFHDRPMVWFATFGLAFLFLAILLGIASVLLFFAGQHTIVFFTSSILFFFLFGSVFSWGLLAEFFIKIERSNK